MFGKLLELILGAKSGALSGVLIVAGAVVTVTGGNGVTTVTIEHPSPSPIIEVSVDPKPSPLEAAEPSEPPKEREEKERADKERAGAPSPESCADEAHARNEARQKVQAAFTKFHVALEQPRGEHKGAKAAETLSKADAMLREIAEKADRILREMGRCPDTDREHAKPKDRDKHDDDEDEDEDRDEDDDEDEAKARVTVVAASRVEADAGAMQQVAERAVAAMETVYNLARSAAEATPTPTPTAKPTAKPRPTEKPKATPKPSRTPSCDDKIHAAKKVLAAEFERFHSANDKLWHEAEEMEDEALFAVVKAADHVMHSTYDSSKDAIAKAGCGEGAGMQVATRAAATFERAFVTSKDTVEQARR